MCEKSLFIIFLTCLAVATAQNISTNDDIFLSNKCTAVPDLFIQNRTRELQCCQEIIEDLFISWSNQGAYLTRTLATLKAWNCPEFDEVCSNRSLAFTDYTSLVYDRFCNESSLIQQCGLVVTEALSEMGVATDSTISNWTALTKNLKPVLLTGEQLDEPCIQVALFDSNNVTWMNYHEMIVYIVPYCNSVWCGFDYETIKREGITQWKCLPTRCKANVIILVVLFIALAIVVVVANFTVILVYSTEKKFRHSQGIFRLSLGVADVIVGLIPLPIAVNTILKTYQNTPQLQTPIIITGQERFFASYSSYNYTNATLTIDMLETTQMEAKRLFPSSYTSSIGFITTMSLTVSIYLLTVSGIDRLLAVSRPLQYRKYVATRFAMTSSIISWVLAILVSIIPIFLRDLDYIITSSSFITLGGRTALILYLIGFFFPLLATWIITAAIYVQAKKKFSKRSNMTSIKQEHIKQQKKLNFILFLMVAAFSLSILPTILVLILVVFIPGTDPRFPQTYNSVFNNIANSLEGAAVIFLISNSIWNSVIYSMRTKTFRKVASAKYKQIWNLINIFKFITRYRPERDQRLRKASKISTTFHKEKTACSVVLLSSRNNSPITSRKDSLNNKNVIERNSLNLEFDKSAV